MPLRWSRFFFALYLFFLVWAEGTVTNPADPDLWHRLALGEALWQTGHFPAGDAFSYLADYPTVADHEWGSALIFYALHRWAGDNIFVLVKLVTLAVTLTLVVLAGMRGRRPTVPAMAFYAVVLLALLPSFQSTVRCMVFTHLFFALWLYWFQAERHSRAVSTAFYVGTMMIWANLHGGFVIGLAWLFLVTVMEFWNGGTWRKWGMRLGWCTLATLVNPFGVGLWVSTVRALRAPRAGFGEWAPVSWWPEPMVYPGYKMLLAGVLVVVIWRVNREGWKKVDRTAIVLLGFFMALSFTSARHTSLFAAVAGALLPGLCPAEPLIENIVNPLRRLSYIALLSALVIIPLDAALIVLPGDGLALRYDAESCPVAAVDYLKARGVRGNLLIPFNYGSYALWELRGRMRVSMDGRYDLVYRPETYRRVDDFFFARGDWPRLLTTPAPEAILLPRADAVYPKLRALPNWKEAWHDETDAVFVK